MFSLSHFIREAKFKEIDFEGTKTKKIRKFKASLMLILPLQFKSAG